MTWNRRTAPSGNHNGFTATFGPIEIEVFKDFGSQDWIVKIPQMNFREEIADANVTQSEVVLDLAEQKALEHLKGLRSTLNLAINAINHRRKYPEPINWNGKLT